MPSSIVFLLSTKSTIPAGHFGRQVQAWFLAQVERIDPALSSALHEQKRFNPYTISDLLPITTAHTARGLLNSNNMRLLRLTLLDDAFTGYFIDNVLPRIPDQLKIWWVDFKLEEVYTIHHQHPLAQSISYQELFASAVAKSHDCKACLNFFSPTAFKTGRAETPLPLPGSIFHSLWDKWNAFCPDELQLNEDWPQFAAENIAVRGLKNINNRHLVFADGARGGETGFTGEVEFELLHRPKDSPYPFEAWHTASQVMETLTDYAFYAGVGHHTTIGLGQVHRIGPNNV